MVDPQSIPSPKNRFDVLGRNAGVRRKPEGGPLELTARHRLLVIYQIDGCPHQSACDRIFVERAVTTEEGTAMLRRHPRPHEPLSLIEAADLLRIKRRNARELASLPIFKNEYERQLQLYRDGERARNLHTMVAMRDDPGFGKAADRKVRLQAAALLNGEAGNSTTVNVSVGDTKITAGVVIERFNRDEDDVAVARTIEHEDRR